MSYVLKQSCLKWIIRWNVSTKIWIQSLISWWQNLTSACINTDQFHLLLWHGSHMGHNKNYIMCGFWTVLHRDEKMLINQSKEHENTTIRQWICAPRGQKIDNNRKWGHSIIFARLPMGYLFDLGYKACTRLWTSLFSQRRGWRWHGEAEVSGKCSYRLAPSGQVQPTITMSSRIMHGRDRGEDRDYPCCMRAWPV